MGVSHNPVSPRRNAHGGIRLLPHMRRQSVPRLRGGRHSRHHRGMRVQPRSGD